jgi:hypothetical protein
MYSYDRRASLGSPQQAVHDIEELQRQWTEFHAHLTKVRDFYEQEFSNTPVGKPGRAFVRNTFEKLDEMAKRNPQWFVDGLHYILAKAKAYASEIE